MRDFQGYTRERKGTRRIRWWMWTLPVVLVGLFLGTELSGGLVSLQTLTHAAQPDPGKVDASPSDWVQKMFGEDEITDGPLNVLVQADPKSGDIKLLSVPRDLYVKVEPGDKDRINAAYNYGGIDQTIDALENYSDVPVDHYATIDFEGFEKVIDAMGGVRVDVGEGQFPEKFRMGEGVQKLNGHKALIFARYRGTP